VALVGPNCQHTQHRHRVLTRLRYDEERTKARQGVAIVPPEERRQAIGMKRSASVERIENDNAVLKRAHMQSVREHILELREVQQQAAAGRAAAMAEAAKAAAIAVEASVETRVEAVVEATASSLLYRAKDCAPVEQAWEEAWEEAWEHAGSSHGALMGGRGSDSIEY